tara:strand:- start:12897 stop:13094 length:198 start_codon:yes stop_codon:yes gene_type:complete
MDKLESQRRAKIEYSQAQAKVIRIAPGPMVLKNNSQKRNETIPTHQTTCQEKNGSVRAKKARGRR